MKFRKGDLVTITALPAFHIENGYYKDEWGVIWLPEMKECVGQVLTVSVSDKKLNRYLLNEVNCWFQEQVLTLAESQDFETLLKAAKAYKEKSNV